MTLRQTVSVTLLTAESRSISTSAAIYNRTSQQAVLAYTYANEPELRHRPRSQPHTGASEFRITGREPEDMSGTYWTARLTVGDMTMRLLDRKTDYSSLSAVTAAATLDGGDQTEGLGNSRPAGPTAG